MAPTIDPDEGLEHFLERLVTYLNMLDDLPERLQVYELNVCDVLEGIREIDAHEATDKGIRRGVLSPQARHHISKWYAHGLTIEQIAILCGPSLDAAEVEAFVIGERRHLGLDEREVYRLHRAGASVPEMARILGSPTSTVQSYLDRHGMKANLRRPRVSQQLRDRVITMRNAGKVYGDIEQDTGLTLTQIKSVLRYAAKRGMVRGYGESKVAA